MPKNKHKSSGSDKNASKKEEGNNPTLSDIVEDLSSYFKKFSHFKKYEDDIKRKYQKYYNTTLPDRWPVEFINKAWRKTTKHMYTFSDRRKCWSLAILLQVMKRSQGYDEREELQKKHSKDSKAQSDPKGKNQQSGGDPSANKSVYICIPFTEMIDNQKYNAPETDQNATKTDKNASETDTNATKTDKNATKTDKIATKTDKNATKTDKIATKTDKNASETDKNATKTDKNATKTDKNATKTDKNATKTDKNATKTDKNATKTDKNATKTDKNATKTDKNATKTDKNATKTDKNATKTDKNASETDKYTYKLIDKVPSPTQILQNDFYITLFDNRTRNAAWVYEILNKSPKVNNNVSRKNIFFKENTLVHPLFRPSTKSYMNTVYDRGHLAAAANHKWCQETFNDTYYITNVVPQQRDFNKGLWSKLEELCRKISQKDEVRNVHVYTGPLYLPSNENNDQNKSESKGENNGNNNKEQDESDWCLKYKFVGGKAVPTHLFKVIIVENEDGTVLKPECYMMKNEKPANSNSWEELTIEEKKELTKKQNLTKIIAIYEKKLEPYIEKIDVIQKNSGMIFEETEIREEMEDGTWKVHWRKNPAEEGKGTKIEVTVSGSYTDHSDRAVLH